MRVAISLGILLALVGPLLGLSGTPAAAQETITIPVGDTWFCASSFQAGVCDTVINAGDTVVWDFSGAQLPHTTTACGASCDNPTNSPLWDSGIVNDGSTFRFTFLQPGTYAYYCVIHTTLQKGRIIVQAPPPTATPPPPTADNGQSGTVTPALPTTPQPTPSGGTLPGVGQGPQPGTSDWSVLFSLAGAGAAGVALGAAAYRRSREG